MFKMLPMVAVLVGSAARLSGQTIEAPDTFKVSYFSNANALGFPDGMVRITNAGTQTGSAGHTLGNLCAMIYVLDPSQELDECCGCSLSPDSLRTLSVNINLTSNPLTSVTLTNATSKSSLPAGRLDAIRRSQPPRRGFAPGPPTFKTTGTLPKQSFQTAPSAPRN